MSLTDPAYTLAAFAKFEFPGGDVRLCDDGVLAFDSEIYARQDAVWGGIAEVPPIESQIGDMAPGGSITLAPHPDTALSVLMDPAVDGSRIQAWLGEVGADGVVAAADRIADWIVDLKRNRLVKGARFIVLELITRLERLFLTNRGNVCSPRFHKRIWADELGFDNCTDVEVSVAWGTQAAPSGTTGSAGRTPPGGGGARGTWSLN